MKALETLQRLPHRHDPRLPFLAILAFYVLLGITVLGFNRSPGQVLTLVSAACLLDVLLHRLLRGAWLFPLSAAITGLSLAILVNYAHGPWLALVPVLFAIGSKYLFTVGGRHVYNPSLFGIVASLALGGGMISAAPAYQWGGSAAMAAFVVTLALTLFVFRIHRSALILSFLGFFTLALLLRAWALRHHFPPETLILGALTSPAFYLFTFFMITDPATSPKGRLGQVAMAFVIVAADLALHTVQSLSTLFYAAFIYFSLRFLWLHGQALWQQGMARARRSALTGTTRLGLLGLIGLPVWAGVHSLGTLYDPQPPGFRLQRLESGHTGITGRKGEVLAQVDPRLQHVAKWLLAIGDAAAVADFDNDGLQDLFLTHPLKAPEDRAALYRNTGGLRFERVPLPELEPMRRRPHAAGLPSGALWLDQDNDGDQDLLVLAGFGRSVLLSNRLTETGQATFVDISKAMGMDAYTISVAANALDIDRDGRLDLVVANAMSPWLPGYAEPTPFNIFALPAPEYPGDRRMLNVMHRSWHDADNGGENLVYRSTGQGFQHIAGHALGLDGHRWTLDIGTGDLNGDGWTDLYLANDFGPDQLYLNRQGQGFEEIRGLLVGELGRDTYKGMNASLADVDGNGTLDIYVSNVHEALQAEGSLLWLNDGTVDRRGARAFRDSAAARNALNPRRFGWGAAIGDLDRDGRPDILQANGMVDNTYDPLYADCPDYWYWNEKIALTGPEIHGYADRWADLRGRCVFPYEKNRIMLNRGAYFVDVADRVGWEHTDNARGIALADFDNDGDLDVVMTHQFAPASVYRNESGPRVWVGLQLEGNGRDCNRDAVGTRVVLRYRQQARPTEQVREVQASNGFSAQGDRRLLFGLGDGAEKITASVHWCGAETPERFLLGPTATTTCNRDQARDPARPAALPRGHPQPRLCGHHPPPVADADDTRSPTRSRAPVDCR